VVDLDIAGTLMLCIRIGEGLIGRAIRENRK